MKKSDLIEILTEIENLILTSTMFSNTENLNAEDLKQAISQRIKELSYDEWAG